MGRGRLKLRGVGRLATESFASPAPKNVDFVVDQLLSIVQTDLTKILKRNEWFLSTVDTLQQISVKSGHLDTIPVCLFVCSHFSAKS